MSPFSLSYSPEEERVSSTCHSISKHTELQGGVHTSSSSLRNPEGANLALYRQTPRTRLFPVYVCVCVCVCVWCAHVCQSQKSTLDGSC